ncbi:Disease resistance protein L6 [Linum perenne]
MRPSFHSDSSSSASCLAHGEELEVKFDLWSALLSSSFWWLMVSFIDPAESGSINKGHPYQFLDNYGIHTFLDIEELRRGGNCGLEMIKAIEESKVYVLIFSPGYASSKWCMREVAQMVKCCKEGKGHVILPIFYLMEPRDVRYQKRSYEEAFQRHSELPDLSRLKQLCKLDISGCTQLTEIVGLEELDMLEELMLHGCTSIKKLPDLSHLKHLWLLHIAECTQLTEIRGLEDLDRLRELMLTEVTGIEKLKELRWSTVDESKPSTFREKASLSPVIWTTTMVATMAV